MSQFALGATAKNPLTFNPKTLNLVSLIVLAYQSRLEGQVAQSVEQRTENPLCHPSNSNKNKPIKDAKNSQWYLHLSTCFYIE